MKKLTSLLFLVLLAACSTESPFERDSHTGGTTDGNESTEVDTDRAALADPTVRAMVDGIELRLGDPGILFVIDNDKTYFTLRDLSSSTAMQFNIRERSLMLNGETVVVDAHLLHSESNIYWYRGASLADNTTSYIVYDLSDFE